MRVEQQVRDAVFDVLSPRSSLVTHAQAIENTITRAVLDQMSLEKRRCLERRDYEYIHRCVEYECERSRNDERRRDDRRCTDERRERDERRDLVPSRRAVSSPRAADESFMRQLSAQISQAGDTDGLLRLAAAHGDHLNHIHTANLWNKLGRQRDTSQPRHREQVESLLRRTIELLSSCEERQLANIVHGLAKTGVHTNEADRLYAAVAGAATRSMSGFKPQELANTVWAFATAGVRADALYAAVAGAATRSVSGFTLQDLANTAWAFATADVEHPALSAQLKLAITSSLLRAPESWDVAKLSQVHQWQLCLMLDAGTGSSHAHLLGDELRRRCCDAMQDAATHPSQLQRSVGAVVDEIHPGFEQETIEQQTGYSLDLALRSSRVAIEVDGPSHFLRDSSRGENCPNGPTRLKRRLLLAADWHLVSVPFYEWDGLNGREAQREYLKGKLGAVGL